MTTVQPNKAIDDLMAAMNPAKKATQSTSDAAQDRFMTLLVTQMRNQDPLNPLDNAQVTSQLAQLSTVTGIDKLNTTMQSLMSSYQTGQAVQAASMIGHGVFVPGSTIELTESKSVFGIELPAAADNIKVTVTDSKGAVVRTIDVGSQKAGIVPVAWDGKTDSDAVAPDGNYTFKVKATMGTEKIDATALSFGTVGSVSSNAQGVKLSLPGIGEFNMTDVRQIL
ncbi:flagellar hook assembly protein FlgD [Noviherbaspirillum denitrificans]|uniref:Basal-body rod modification protein FlgD n=1 Tax=Noviherbaspirillum denitrificans TaxID=1968433 RepID=A0A254TBF0_9BURK|nr:flagellar hook assembly protein FlgD [Noviherbaspirillum denitrificans]OWW19986.1 flagellar biosynthesis protein FlgD [Noviherbaspirillum denitrificans]